MFGYYIHIPFCRSRCHYCDFASYAGKENQIDSYLNALETELKFKKLSTSLPSTLYPLPLFDTCSLRGVHSKPLKAQSTLYIGGGTPGFLPLKQLTALLKTVDSRLGPLKKFKETTFEANPDSLSSDKIKTLKKFGINRISLGLQTANDKLLNNIGRKAREKDFDKTYNELIKNGFKNINVDIMCGIPNQTLKDLKQTLDKVINLNPAHISVYGLEIHKGTVLYENKIKTDEDLTFRMYETAGELFEKAGYNHYEISNFAKKGFESAHNLNYWRNGEYIGLGCAAASYLNGTRFKNTADLDAYIKSMANKGKPELEYSETLSGKEKLGEQIILSLRTAEGIELNDHIFIEFKDNVRKLLKFGLVEIKNGRLRIKKKHFYISNKIFSEFV